MAVKKAAVKVIKLPKTLAGCADRLFTLREEKSKAQRGVDAFKEEEAALRDHLIEKLPVGEAAGIIGKLAAAEVTETPTASVKDWNAVYAWIHTQLLNMNGTYTHNSARAKELRAGIFAIMGRSIAQDTVKEMWDNKQTLPGVERIRIKKVSVTKRKARG